MAFKNSPIDGHLFSGTDAEPVPNLDLIERHVGFAALVVKPLRCLRSQAKERANRTAGLAAGAQLQHLSEKYQSDDYCCRLEIYIDLSSAPTKRGWKYLRNNGCEDAVKVGRPSPKRYKRKHVQAAMDDGLPASDKEGQCAPQDHRGCQSELYPSPGSCREQVLHGHRGEKSRDHQREHGHGECDADPEPLRHIAQLWIGVFGSDFAGTVTGSSAMPHFGQLPGPFCLISGCMGQVYSPCGPVFTGTYAEASSGLVGAYFSGAARNFAAQPRLQK